MPGYDSWKTRSPDDDLGSEFDDDIDDEQDEMAWAEMMCGMHSDGQCGQAGSEYCEFECPFRELD